MSEFDPDTLSPEDRKAYDDEQREWTWRDITPSVGYHLSVPRKELNALGPKRKEYRDRFHRLWVNKLERYVKQCSPEARVSGPIETSDFIGFPTWYVMVWAEVMGEDVWSLRGDLEEGGFHVSSITISYEPAMA